MPSPFPFQANHMAEVTLDTVARIPDDTVFRELDGEAVLLQVAAGMYYGLDPVGTRLWQLIAERGSLRDVHTAALAEYDVDASVLERDLLDLVRALLDRQLLAVA